MADTDGGLFVGARRNAEDGQYYWRITPWVMPSFTMVPPRGDHPMHGHFWVPIDDENCWVYTFDYHPVRPLTDDERQAMKDGYGVHSENIPGTYRPQANKDNDYLMDREAQRRGEHFSGVAGIAMQDASLQESMGPIVDRTKERLVPADSGHHQGPPEAAQGGDRAARRGRHVPRASTRRTTASVPPPSCCPRRRRSSTPSATPSCASPACRRRRSDVQQRPITR